jgi:hypothetical protein
MNSGVPVPKTKEQQTSAKMVKPKLPTLSEKFQRKGC